VSGTGGLALVAVMSLCAGGVVDVGGSAETRALLFGDDAVGTAGVYSATVRPSVRAAVEHPRAAAQLQYAPSLSALVPARQLLLALHSGNAAAELVLTRRLRLRTLALGSIGDLDPGTSQRELFTSLGVIDRARPLSYAAGSAEVGLQAQLSRAATLDVTGALSGVGSPAGAYSSARTEPAPAAVRTLFTRTLGARTSLSITRLDGVFIDAALRSTTVVDGGPLGDESALGVVAFGGYRRALMRGAALEVRAGTWTVVADAADGKGRHLLVLPAGDARASATLDLGGGSAIVGDATAGLLPTNDPLGPLIESRFAAQLGVGARFTRDAFLRGAAFVAAPAWVFGARAPVQPGAGLSATFQWAFSRDTSLDVSAFSISRMLPREPETPRVVALELAIACGVSGTFNVLHSGSRPRGSDPRPGRSLDEREIGAARAPHQEIEPPRELPPLDIDEPVLPPELVPPPVLPAPEPGTTSPDPLKRKRPSDKKPDAAKDDDDDDDAGGPRKTLEDPSDDAGTDATKDRRSTDDKNSQEKTP
jgi:hypothetical protein